MSHPDKSVDDDNTAMPLLIWASYLCSLLLSQLMYHTSVSIGELHRTLSNSLLPAFKWPAVPIQ
jgi:hypothetical protein